MKGFFFPIAPANENCPIKYMKCRGITVTNTFQNTPSILQTCPAYAMLANVPAMYNGNNGIITVDNVAVTISWKSLKIFQDPS